MKKSWRERLSEPPRDLDHLPVQRTVNPGVLATP
jgi:hypothetical protein